MTYEFNLSDKIQVGKFIDELDLEMNHYILDEDVKEFIRLLKEEIIANAGNNEENRIYLRESKKMGIFDILDKLAGEKLK